MRFIKGHEKSLVGFEDLISGLVETVRKYQLMKQQLMLLCTPVHEPFWRRLRAALLATSSTAGLAKLYSIVSIGMNAVGPISFIVSWRPVQNRRSEVGYEEGRGRLF